MHAQHLSHASSCRRCCLSAPSTTCCTKTCCTNACTHGCATHSTAPQFEACWPEKPLSQPPGHPSPNLHHMVHTHTHATHILMKHISSTAQALEQHTWRKTTKHRGSTPPELLADTSFSSYKRMDLPQWTCQTPACHREYAVLSARHVMATQPTPTTASTPHDGAPSGGMCWKCG